MKRSQSLLLVPVLIAACGGAAPTQQPAGTGTTATSAPATTGTGSTDGPAATGGATTTDWCLNAPAEVEAALGVTGVTGVGNDATGVGGGCFYSAADGTAVHAISVVSSQGFEATFEAGKQTPGVVEIPGIGKGAILMSAQGPLVVLMDNGIISMGPLGPAELMSDPAAYRTAAETLARAAVGRMP